MSDRQRWIAEACAHVTAERLRELITGIVDVPSPTGFEAPLAGHLARTLTDAGVAAEAQPLDEHQANALGRLRGDGTGADLMLYAPIDTLTTGDAEQDVPWIGPELRPDMRAEAAHDGDFVTGLGASNPKGHVACVAMAAEAIARAGVPLSGDLVAAFGAGGMPTNALPASTRRNTGQGAGCSFLLEQGGWTDFAVIAKPGWTVSWEEVGLAWFDIEVGGTHTYVGSRHRLPYANAIARAGEVAVRLERWFAGFAERHTGGTVSPQGVIASIEGGWRRMAATTPAACRLRADLRLPPGFSPLAAKRELAAELARIGEELSIPDIGMELVLAIPGTHTPPDSWVARSAIAAWEETEGRPHEVIRGNSGATDANILRGRGIPTVRVGMPKVAHAADDFSLGMNTVDVREMVRLTRLLVRVAVDTTTRPRSEVGL
ncbi:M20 family metallopeptidase [Prauserella cavernicola]|uniref:M20/M25/M40 family metallo-hydrolase n=1 Tax=Prauserella cavernicola TaxID=2800127 RepID=A0A934QR77_9PSEU|nr:M20/M25/M40 family metallo-hydrolase [Prauserella cavernicola]MBK1784890.1 M20/M25/M40 family metallo-hydrolase [Prauserella cavernicola]